MGVGGAVGVAVGAGDAVAVGVGVLVAVEVGGGVGDDEAVAVGVDGTPPTSETTSKSLALQPSPTWYQPSFAKEMANDVLPCGIGTR